MKRQFIIDNKGKKTAIILPIKEYEKLLAEHEDNENARLYYEGHKNAMKIPKETTFNAIAINTIGYKFNREEANER